MKPEDGKEESSEGVEHFDKEVPPEADVGSEVRECELDAIRADEELPRVAGEHERHAEKEAQAHGCNGHALGAKDER